MRRRTLTTGRVLAFLLVFVLIAAACGDDDEPAPTTAPTTAPPGATTMAPTTMAPTTMAPAGPVTVCELAYYTGEFAAFGEFLTAGVQFPIDNIINDDPPLGREWQLVSEDLGTVGEGQAARTCLEQHGAEILVSPAHGYRNYRDFVLEWVEENDGPLMPTVHGGTIPQNLGGTADEPIFRAQGLDEALGMTGSLYAADHLNAETVVVFATQVEGYQLAAGAAVLAAEAIGLEVLERIDAPAEQPSYRAEAERIADLNPDAVIVQATSIETATLIKEAAEAGASLFWIGESGLAIPEFIPALGVDTIPTQEGIGFAGFAPNTSTPAWDFYAPLWENTEGYGDTHGEAGTNYHYSAYDVMVHTALAVEYAGSYNASDWAPAMFAVGDPPGTVCYTYDECLALIRAGEDVDYEGVTGPGAYTEGGVNAVTPSFTPYNDDGTVGEPVLLDAERALDVIGLIAVEAECDDNNVCTW